MRRIIAFVIFFTIAYLLFQFSVVFFKVGHNIDYSLKIGEKEYFVNEIYSKNKRDELYLLTVKVDNKEFIFDIDNVFNKQRNIIKDMMIHEDNEILCLYPIFLNNKTVGELQCYIGGERYNYFGISDSYDLKSFVATLPGYIQEIVSDQKVEGYTDLKVFVNNMMDNEHILLYNYKNIYNIKKTGIRYTDFSVKDVYINKKGILVGDYYVVPDGNHAGIHEYMATINIVTNELVELPLRNKLSSNYYINGVVEDVLYIFDKSNLIQYSINPAYRDIRIEGDKESPCKVYEDGKWKDVTAYDLLNEEVKFTEDYSDLKVEYEVVSKTDRYYYYKIGKSFYKSYIDAPDKSIHLFSVTDASVVKMVNDGIYYISGTTLYRYTANNILPILQRNELQYNRQNIYEVYWENDNKK